MSRLIPIPRLPMLAACAAMALLAGPRPAAAADPSGDASRYVAFVEEDSGRCADRNARQVQVKNTHPTRTLRVYLDRYHMGKGTGDRSRSELAPGKAEPLGCARTMDGPQEWRLVRAQFVE